MLCKARRRKGEEGGLYTDKLLTKALDRCNQPAPWYQSSQLHFVLGSLISGGVCAATMRFGK